MGPARAGLQLAAFLPLIAARDPLPKGEAIMGRYIAVNLACR